MQLIVTIINPDVPLAENGTAHCPGPKSASPIRNGGSSRTRTRQRTPRRCVRAPVLAGSTRARVRRACPRLQRRSAPWRRRRPQCELVDDDAQRSRTHLPRRRGLGPPPLEGNHVDNRARRHPGKGLRTAATARDVAAQPRRRGGQGRELRLPPAPSSSGAELEDLLHTLARRERPSQLARASSPPKLPRLAPGVMFAQLRWL